jgi:hypothetical protein
MTNIYHDLSSSSLLAESTTTPNHGNSIDTDPRDADTNAIGNPHFVAMVVHAGIPSRPSVVLGTLWAVHQVCRV